MAFTINCSNENVVGIEDYVEHILDHVDLTDQDSIAESAPWLRALANDRNLVANIFNENINKYLSGDTSDMYSPQSFMIAMKDNGKKRFYVRGNIWTPVAAASELRALEERVFSYNIAHDHDFRFMTVGYWGDGYETHIYEAEQAIVKGYIGESVPMRLLEKTRLPFGKVMLYRPYKDIHIQLPPPEMSISLNLMIQDLQPCSREQYFYDVERQVIAGYPYHAGSFSRCTLVQMASYVGNESTIDLLVDIYKREQHPRMRLTALDGLLQLVPDAASSLLEQATNDSNVIISEFASAALADDNAMQLKIIRNRLGLALRSEVSTISRAGLAEERS